MKLNTKIRMVGNSKMILIPYEVVEKLNLEPGDEVEVDITSLTKKVYHYRCKACQHQFDMENDNPYCPACQGEGLEVIEDGE